MKQDSLENEKNGTFRFDVYVFFFTKYRPFLGGAPGVTSSSSEVLGGSQLASMYPSMAKTLEPASGCSDCLGD